MWDGQGCDPINQGLEVPLGVYFRHLSPIWSPKRLAPILGMVAHRPNWFN